MGLLDSKIGGVPTVAIGGGVGLLVVGALYMQSRNKGSAEPSVQLYPDLGPGSGDKDDSAQVFDESAFTSNATWLAQAVRHLISLGHSPFAVTQALTKYLAGAAITAQEREWVNIAIEKFGLPPQGVQDMSEVIPETPVLSQPDYPYVPTPAPAPPKVVAPVLNYVRQANENVRGRSAVGAPTPITTSEKSIAGTKVDSGYIDRLENQLAPLTQAYRTRGLTAAERVEYNRLTSELSGLTNRIYN